MIFLSLAWATSGFDPSTPEEVWTGAQTATQDGETPLWSAIERWEDPDRTLFVQEEFGDGFAWLDTPWSPWIATCLGPTPHSSEFLLHVGRNEATASGTPIVFVHGAGDNGSRGFITMATRMDLVGRPVYAITFAHPHGDVFRQAEVLADTLAVVRARTGAAEVDVVAHSKGGLAAVVYASNDGGGWRTDYDTVGTPYQGDIRRMVLIATPLGGIDTTYRWPAGNLASLDPDAALSPSSWATYYPYTTGNLAVSTDLSAQDFLPGGGDLFPGHRQLLARQDHDLPGSMATLGAYALQPDWYTTYEGGLGYWSYSDGIDAAIDAGSLIEPLRDRGVDPDIELFVLAGESPLMPNGTEDYLAQLFGEAWVDMATAGTDAWAEALAALVSDGLTWLDLTDSDVQGLASGHLMLGEISGRSDGLVFVDSATDTSALTARGAVVEETRIVDLSHIDLLYASELTGELLVGQAEADPTEDGWKKGVGERYIEADTLGWVEQVLADPESDTDTDADSDTDTDTDTDTDADSDTDTDTDADTDTDGGCSGGCTATPAPWWLALLLPLALRRRHAR